MSVLGHILSTWSEWMKMIYINNFCLWKNSDKYGIRGLVQEAFTTNMIFALSKIYHNIIILSLYVLAFNSCIWWSCCWIIFSLSSICFAGAGAGAGAVAAATEGAAGREEGARMPDSWMGHSLSWASGSHFQEPSLWEWHGSYCHHCRGSSRLSYR